jgi:SagB-type dehydrogenase family enzyme
MIKLDDPTTLSLLFHLNSEPWLNDEAYTAARPPAEVRRVVGVANEVKLPAPASSPLMDLVVRRRSCRAFAPRTVPAATVSSLLAAAYGLVDEGQIDPGAMQRRAVPSAGGLFPLEMYALLRRVEDIDDGLYHYGALGHALQRIQAGDLLPSLEAAFYTYPFIRDCNLVLMVTAEFQRTQKKYGPRGYRYILIEAGHVGQNVCLRSAELGLATLCMGGFVDSTLMATLRLDAARDGVVYAIAIGHAAIEAEPATS